ncbi:aminotransferase class I/II-fold pyridoxal phosphate-dependent enzyme [Myxococcota bacterium]|nr:aminotransferase class I/II-fold pyridoxal phosphate-dependent enzyme [Myxococcota bacterium]
MTAPGDFRSDTVTRPTAGMLRAMTEASVGDDVFGDDPTVAALQARAAALLGVEAALFVPSGTMANQIAMLTHCRPGDDVLVGEGSHSYLYEGGGGAALAGVQFTLVGTGGLFDAAELLAAVKGPDASGHAPPTRLLMLENTHNRGGGRIWAPDRFAAVVAAARSRELAIHLDGARLFNAAVATGLPPSTWAARVDSVSFCLSKGLGCPVGSLLCGSEAFVRRAHRYRKMLGGGMRQSGLLAAAGLYALEHHIERLAEDHRRARRLAEGLARLPGLRIDPAGVETNIVIAELEPGAPTPAAFCAALATAARALPFGPRAVRFVTHLDVTDADVERALSAAASVLGEGRGP